MRLIISTALGLAIATALFLLMSSMISGTPDVSRGANELLNLDFIQLDLDEVENIRRRLPPPEPEQSVERPELPLLNIEPREISMPAMPDIDLAGILASGVRVPAGLERGRFTGEINVGDSMEDGDIVAILRIEPIYPQVAVMRKLKGWVDLEYVVLPDGSVANARVIASEPEGIFDAAALRAVGRWKFKPRVVNGVAVPRGVEQRINFNVFE